MVSKECVTVTAPHAAIPPAMKDPIVVDMSPSLQPPLLLLLLPACGCRVCILLHVHADGEGSAVARRFSQEADVSVVMVVVVDSSTNQWLLSSQQSSHITSASVRAYSLRCRKPVAE